MSRQYWPGQAEAIVERARAQGRVVAEFGEGQKPKRQGKRRRQMNATEARFARFLEASRVRRQQGEGFEVITTRFSHFVYEGITLRWGDETEELKYTADFALYGDWIGSTLPGVTPPLLGITLVEVKGAHCWKADLVRYKAAKIAHPQFLFQFWQEVDGEWKETR